MNLRSVSPNDFDLICRHREAMFREMGEDDAMLSLMREPFRVWLAPRLDDGTYFGFIAEDDNVPVAGIGLLANDFPPGVRHPETNHRGYVLNVYVEPSHRRQGLARQLVRQAEAELKTRGIVYAVLHAADAARPLYESLGWATTREMAKAL